SFGGNSNSAFGGGSSFGGGSNSAFGGGFGSSGNSGTASNSTASSGSGNQSTGSDPTQSGNSQNSSSTSGSSSGQGNNQVFGGGPIVGVVSVSKKDTIREFNHKHKYNEWQFVYDPTLDRGGLILTPNQTALQLAATIPDLRMPRRRLHNHRPTRPSKCWTQTFRKEERPHQEMRPFCCSRQLITKERRNLDAERRSAATGALDVRILEFESGAFQSLDIIHQATVQIHHGSGVHKDLKAVHLEGFVHHSRGILELHGIRETGTAAAHHADAQTSRHGILLSHDLFHFGNRAGGKRNRGGLLYFRDVGCNGDGGRSHLSLLGSGMIKL